MRFIETYFVYIYNIFWFIYSVLILIYVFCKQNNFNYSELIFCIFILFLYVTHFILEKTKNSKILHENILDENF